MALPWTSSDPSGGLAVLVFGSLGALVAFLVAVDLGMRRDRRKAEREAEREKG